MAVKKQAYAGGSIWYPLTFAELVSIGSQAVIGDRAYLLSCSVELVRCSVGGSDKWVPLDPTWGTNSTTSVPCGAVSSEGVWTIPEGTNNLGNADVNKKYDVLGVLIEATTGNTALVPSGVTQVPSFLQINCVNLTREDTANTVVISVQGLGFAGGASATAGGGPTSTAYHGQFSCCASGGSGGGSNVSSGGNSMYGGEYWKTGTINRAIGGTAGNPGNAGYASTNIPTTAFTRTNLGGHCVVGGGGGGGGASGGNGGAGGAGGGALIVHSAEVVSNATGIMFYAAGNTGSNAVGANAGGGGGGAGGYVRHLYRVKTGDVTCSAAAGSGGTKLGGGGNGGAGGSGLVVTQQV